MSEAAILKVLRPSHQQLASALVAFDKGGEQHFGINTREAYALYQAAHASSSTSYLPAERCTVTTALTTALKAQCVRVTRRRAEHTYICIRAPSLQDARSMLQQLLGQPRAAGGAQAPGQLTVPCNATGGACAACAALQAQCAQLSEQLADARVEVEDTIERAQKAEAQVDTLLAAADELREARYRIHQLDKQVAHWRGMATAAGKHVRRLCTSLAVPHPLSASCGADVGSSTADSGER